MKFNDVVLTLISFAICGCGSAKMKNISCFEFRSDGFSPTGHVYALSSISFKPDSTFLFIDYLFHTRDAQKKGRCFKKETFEGNVRIVSDTIVCSVVDPIEFRGSEFVFNRKGTKLILLDNRKRPLQTWRPCTVSNKYAALQR
jgi:hypothetical protein